MLDCLLLIIPKLDPYGPLIGPNLLKACLQDNGFSAKVKDYNIELYNNINETHGSLWFGEDDTFLLQDHYDKLYNSTLKPYIKRWANECLEENANWIGISLFTQRSNYIAVSLMQEIKRKNPNQKIVLGGAGLSDLEIESSLAVANEYGAKIICDAFIYGDGESALVSLLNGKNVESSFKSPMQEDDLDSIPFPDYSDVNWSSYVNDPVNDIPVISVTGSRGCVRKCTFCTVPALWPKYRFRSGRNIAEEIEYLYKETGLTYFEFTDSLINGSMKAYRDMCIELTKLNNQLNDKILWTSQFICRSERQMPEKDWELTAKSGCQSLAIGIESGSEAVREHMKKKFTDEDMWFTFEMAAKYNIQVRTLLLIGYPTETKEDFQETIELVEGIYKINKKYKQSNPHHVFAGRTMFIVPQIPVYAMATEMGINDRDNVLNWEYKDNTRAVRLQRQMELLEACDKFGFHQNKWIKARLPALIHEYNELMDNDLSIKQIAI